MTEDEEERGSGATAIGDAGGLRREVGHRRDSAARAKGGGRRALQGLSVAACAPGRSSRSPADSPVNEQLDSQSRTQVCLGGKITFLFGKSLFFFFNTRKA